MLFELCRGPTREKPNGRFRLALTSAALLLLARPADAQMSPGGFGGPGGGMQPPPAQGAEKEEGPAEEAPEESRPSDLEPLTGYPEQSKRKMQILELNGYLRLRDDYMHDFFLGLGYSNVPSGSRSPGLRATVCPLPRAARLPLTCVEHEPHLAVRECAAEPGVRTAGPRISAARTSASGSSRR